MAVGLQSVTQRYAIYNGDCIDVMAALPNASIHLSIYSPPFAGLYVYSSSERDMSNCVDYGQFFEQYEYTVREMSRLTIPGRMSIVHCMDVPTGNTGCDSYIDFPGDIIRLHERHGFRMASPRIAIWKEPLGVRNRTMTKALAHKSIVEDSCDCAVAGADYLLIFRRAGVNRIPVTHEHGLMSYAGARPIPPELLRYRGWRGKQTENRYSHWIWRQYASAFWDDIRIKRVLPFREAREEEDEKHVHPLQLDVIERAVVLWSNPKERVLTPYMGVGSEVCGAIENGRVAIGAELKESYYRQSVKNIESTIAKGLDDSADQQVLDFSDEEGEVEEQVEEPC